MHTLRSSPGEKKATCHCNCWFCSPHITNPSLILFGKNVMQPKLEQECLCQGRPSLLGGKESKNRKILSTLKCVEVVQLSEISYLKVPAVEEQCFVLFCFNHQRSTVPRSSVTSLTLQVYSLQIYAVINFPAHWAHIVHVQYTLVTKVKPRCSYVPSWLKSTISLDQIYMHTAHCSCCQYWGMWENTPGFNSRTQLSSCKMHSTCLRKITV